MTRRIIPFVDLQSRPWRDTQPETEAQIEARVARARAYLEPLAKDELALQDRIIRDIDRRLPRVNNGTRRAELRAQRREAMSERQVLHNIIHGAEPLEPYEAASEGAEVAETIDIS